MKIASDREYVQYLWGVKPTKEATKSIIEWLVLLYYERKELSGSSKYFVRVLVRNGVPQTCDFRFLHEIHGNRPEKESKRHHHTRGISKHDSGIF
jgi:hypothetical protein